MIWRQIHNHNHKRSRIDGSRTWHVPCNYVHNISLRINMFILCHNQYSLLSLLRATPMDFQLVLPYTPFEGLECKVELQPASYTSFFWMRPLTPLGPLFSVSLTFWWCCWSAGTLTNQWLYRYDYLFLASWRNCKNTKYPFKSEGWFSKTHKHSAFILFLFSYSTTYWSIIAYN